MDFPTIHDLSTPALLLDAAVLENNLSSMAERARRLEVALRPHIKTHKCVEIARRQRALGSRGITVSTLYEAKVFADHGFDDITWAFPVILNRLEEVRAIASRVRLRLVVDSGTAVDALEQAAFPFEVWLKVDCGYHRVGVDPEQEEAWQLARRIHESENLTFGGILSHSGHAYGAADRAAVAEEERAVMVGFAETLAHHEVEVPEISVGSTPAMMAVKQLNGVTEARPGNYALFDYSQVAMGSCAPTDCAVTVMASVVSSNSRQCVIDAGALALSKDLGPEDGTFGKLFRDDSSELEEDLYVASVSQEHGKLNRPLPVGTRVRILPHHSCLTMAMFDEVYVQQEGQVIDRWRIWRGR